MILGGHDRAAATGRAPIRDTHVATRCKGGRRSPFLPVRLLALVAAAIRATHPWWVGAGQLALIVLGVHLAADRIDDAVAAALAWLPVAEDRDWGIGPSVWIALGIELVVVARAATLLALTDAAPTLTRRTWRELGSVDGVVAPMFWVAVAGAGAWSLGMAVEDAFAPLTSTDAGRWGAIAVALLALGRLGFPGLVRVIGGLRRPKRWTDGAVWAPALLLVAIVAIRHGWPLWGLW